MCLEQHHACASYNSDLPSLLWHLSAKNKSTVWDFLSCRLERGKTLKIQLGQWRCADICMGQGWVLKYWYLLNCWFQSYRADFRPAPSYLLSMERISQACALVFITPYQSPLPPPPKDPAHILDFQNLYMYNFCPTLWRSNTGRAAFNSQMFLCNRFYTPSKMRNDKRNSLMAWSCCIQLLQ